MKHFTLILVLLFSIAILSSAVFAQGATKSAVDIFLKNKKKPVESEKKVSAEPEKKDSSTKIESTSAKANSGSACAMTIAQSPALRGLKLGMSIDEVQKLFPKKILKSENYGMPPPYLGFRRISLGLATDPLVANDKITTVDLSGIKSGEMQFLDDVLTSVKFFYDDTSSFYQRENEFHGKVAESLNLPNVWEGNYLNCGEFRVKAKVDAYTYTVVELENLSTDEIVKQRAKEEKDRRRDSFKP